MEVITQNEKVGAGCRIQSMSVCEVSRKRVCMISIEIFFEVSDKILYAKKEVL